MYLTSVFIGLFLVQLGHGYINEYDKDMTFQCPNGEYLSRWISTHNNWYEDREWDFKCTKGFVGTDCSWTDDYVNDWDDPMDFSCPENTILTGAYSTHDNKYDDRRWKFRCCKINTKPGKNCQWTGYMNDWDGDMNYATQTGTATVGVSSYHENSKEDRRYKLKVCSFTICTANKINILDVIEPTNTGARVIGVATTQGCSAETNYLVNLGTTDSVTETYSMTIGESSEFNYEHSLTIGSKAEAGFLGTGTSISVGVTETMGGAVTASSSETHETSDGSGSSSAMTVSFYGPAGAMILGHVKEYLIDQSSVNVEVDVRCEDGSEYTEKTTMEFTSQTYGQAHYTTQLGEFEPKEMCDSASNTCLLALESNYALEPDRVIDEFNDCFDGKGTVTFNQSFEKAKKFQIPV